jgi:hypothetical protein
MDDAPFLSILDLPRADSRGADSTGADGPRTDPSCSDSPRADVSCSVSLEENAPPILKKTKKLVIKIINIIFYVSFFYIYKTTKHVISSSVSPIPHKIILYSLCIIKVYSKPSTIISP